MYVWHTDEDPVLNASFVKKQSQPIPIQLYAYPFIAQETTSGANMFLSGNTIFIALEYGLSALP